MTMTDVDFGWVLARVVLSKAADASVQFAVLRQLDGRTDAGLGEMTNADTGGVWHLFVGNLGVGHRPPPLESGEIYGRLDWKSGSKVLESGNVLIPTAEMSIPVKYTQLVNYPSRCGRCGEPVVVESRIEVQLGETRCLTQMNCRSCEHAVETSSSDVSPEVIAAVQSGDSRRALYLPAVRSQGMLDALARGLPFEHDLGRRAEVEQHRGAFFVGLPYQVEVVRQRLELRRLTTRVVDL